MPPFVPTYRWSCHRCSAENEPGVAQCAACDFPAVASTRDIGFVKYGSERLPVVGVIAGEVGWWTAFLVFIGLH